MELALQQFIWQHRLHEPAQLALQLRKQSDFPAVLVANQVAALQKIAKKIPSWYQEGMQFPVQLSLEQSSSEWTATYKASLIEGNTIADLTGGLGIDSFFFAQRFQAVHYIEQQTDLCTCAKHNFKTLQRDNIQCVNAVSEDWISGISEQFDWVYLDPARRDNKGGRVQLLGDCTPNILEIKEKIFKRTNHILLKTAPMLDISLAVQQLQNVRHIWVVALEDECKEVLYHIEKGASIPASEIPMTVALLSKNAPTSLFEFNIGMEQTADIHYTYPSNFLVEPHAAILKAGAFKSFAISYGLQKLHPNSQLYTSAEAPSDAIMGRVFSIMAVCRYDKKQVQTHIPSGKANISSRNFPDSPEQIRKKLALKDGGDIYLFATSNLDNEKVIIICKKH